MTRTSFIEGDKVKLCPPIESDYGQTMQNWLNDKEVTRYLSRGTLPPLLSLLNLEHNQIDQKSEIVLSIIDKKTETYIGTVGLHSINWRDRHCEFRILIGEKKFWNSGYGMQSCQLIVSYAFEQLNMNKVWLGVNTENTKAANSYIKAGFAHEGILRQEVYKNNKYYDAARMSILKSEYLNKKKTWPVYEWIKKQFSE